MSSISLTISNLLTLRTAIERDERIRRARADVRKRTSRSAEKRGEQKSAA